VAGVLGYGRPRRLRGECGAAGVGRIGPQQAGDRAPAAIEHGSVLVQLPAGVHGGAERIELEGELLGVRAELELAALPRSIAARAYAVKSSAQRLICA